MIDVLTHPHTLALLVHENLVRQFERFVGALQVLHTLLEGRAGLLRIENPAETISAGIASTG